MLEECRLDALLFYDACHSAETAVIEPSAARRGITELIAACGFQTTAPGVNGHSFASSLVEELRSAALTDTPFSVYYLFSQALSRLRHSKSWIQKATPIHTNLVSDQGRRQIMLQPLGERDAVEDKSEILSKHLRMFLGFKTDCNNFDENNWLDWILAAPADANQVYFTAVFDEDDSGTAAE
jgi:hypothetical protein